MRPPDTRVYHANLDALAKVSKVMELADASGVVDIILPSSSVIAESQRLQGREGHMAVDPDPSDIGQLLEAVDVVGVCHNAGTAEDGRLKSLDDVNVKRRGEAVTTGLGRTLKARSVNVTEPKSVTARTHGGIFNDEALGHGACRVRLKFGTILAGEESSRGRARSQGRESSREPRPEHLETGRGSLR
jgi:hypothetical protein